MTVPAHTVVTFHALGAFPSAGTTVVMVALVDKLAFSLAAHGPKVTRLSPLAAVLVAVGLTLALAAEATTAAFVPALAAVLGIVYQVSTPSIATRLALFAAGLLGSALGLVHWGLVAALLLALASLADGVLGAAFATLATVLVVVAQVDTPMVAATGLVEPPMALCGRPAGLGAALSLPQRTPGGDLILSDVGNINNLGRLINIGENHLSRAALHCNSDLQKKKRCQQCQEQHSNLRQCHCHRRDRKP